MTYPSVTQIISPWIDWSQIPPEVLEAAADRGKRVHALCAAHLQGLWIPRIDEDCQGYFDSFRRWVDQSVAEILFVENRMLNYVYKFQGTPDAGLVLKDKSRIVMDWKTPLPLSRSWRLQLAAYFHLAQDNRHQVERMASLRLSRDGKRARFQGYSGTIAYDFYVFLNALSVYHFLKGGH
jgi:hypothetical protein